MKSRHPMIAMLAALLCGAACASPAPPPGPPTVDKPSPLPAGSSWVFAEKTTGSYGAAARHVTIRFLGEQIWNGRQVRVFTDGTTTSYETDRELLATARGTRVTESFEPSYKYIDWPLSVGRSWVNTFRYVNHEKGRYNHVESRVKVDGYEDVSTPSGTLKAFTITYDDRYYAATVWYNPQLGINVRSKEERKSEHSQGPGTRGRELVSYDIRR